MTEKYDFFWVRSAFKQLLSDSPPHVAKVESWHLAIAWIKASPELQERIVAELINDLKREEKA